MPVDDRDVAADRAGGRWFQLLERLSDRDALPQAETKIVQAVVSAMVKTKPTDRDASMTKSDDQKREAARRERLERRAMELISSTCIEIER